MKLTILLVCFLAIFQAAFAAVLQIPADTSPGHPGFCNSDYTGPMEKGAEKNLKNCERANCNDDGSMTVSTCGSVAAPPGVKLIRDMSKPYPDCCPTPEK